jgi:hypothetical protein
MDVYLVPVGADRYELYCEVPDDTVELEMEPAAPGGWWRWPGAFTRRLLHRVKQQFHKVVAEAERERRLARGEQPSGRWLSRMKTRGMRWIAESIAEQRLLWHLRGQATATLFHPDDVPAADAIRFLRQQLARDFDKHQFWLIFDTLGLLGSFLLVPIPGPNPVLYYFAFRVVGHYLSLRGARQGLNHTIWTAQSSAHLTELRRAIALDPALREARVNDIALRLRLEHLATFFERTAVPNV